ncbi:basic salivary proline-rich protein 1-like [Apus apus]|uniref:basic salivary proline-rich protein 1-like n=1 Tax=Apus apus TaxID=8895 RepID=UPI0021F91EBB|nr:basic salivary proline-rich protein 1-like [Apus apus]
MHFQRSCTRPVPRRAASSELEAGDGLPGGAERSGGRSRGRHLPPRGLQGPRPRGGEERSRGAGGDPAPAGAPRGLSQGTVKLLCRAVYSLVQGPRGNLRTGERRGQGLMGSRENHCRARRRSVSGHHPAAPAEVSLSLAAAQMRAHPGHSPASRRRQRRDPPPAARAGTPRCLSRQPRHGASRERRPAGRPARSENTPARQPAKSPPGVRSSPRCWPGPAPRARFGPSVPPPPPRARLPGTGGNPTPPRAHWAAPPTPPPRSPRLRRRLGPPGAEDRCCLAESGCQSG